MIKKINSNWKSVKINETNFIIINQYLKNSESKYCYLHEKKKKLVRS